jgi:hypothetical protein
MPLESRASIQIKPLRSFLLSDRQLSLQFATPSAVLFRASGVRFLATEFSWSGQNGQLPNLVNKHCEEWAELLIEVQRSRESASRNPNTPITIKIVPIWCMFTGVPSGGAGVPQASAPRNVARPSRLASSAQAVLGEFQAVRFWARISLLAAI